MDYEVKDISLANQGQMNIEVARRNMGALMKVKERFSKEKPLKGLRIGMALHITKETANLVETLIAGGADVAITGCNPLSTQDDVAASMAKDGVKVYGYKGESKEDYYKYVNRIIDFKPNITIDDGCDLVSEIHLKHPELIKDIIGGCEETTTGIIRLKSMMRDGALKYPMVAVNDNKTKHLMDNYYGTGQSTLDGIIRASNILFAGKTLVVLGYGSCGKGCSLRGRGMGANVIVTEVDNFCALQAQMDGFRVMKMEDACKLGDIFITVTGDKNVIRLEHMKQMKEAAIMANSGHFDNEIDMKALEKAASSKRRVRHYFDEYVLDGKVLFVAGEGRLVNLAAAEGHPSEVMSLSFCGQALACEFLVKNKGKLSIDVHQLPEEVDDFIAGLQLEAMGVEIDELTEEQIKYLAGWQEGT
ncbi:MAG: adenosylhomocysteinase, adenosylhomocysteinase [Candidatus Peregrinibacteria bacterium GW2011_GWF2_43_17]|nr:MAG: adenosylhomocysteinase, adenosylhomocysteinase [Candidatus Peregrinibacteria bacterium GW2011_GWF2_43_17]KKT19025.1 MAG: Adenosylhomocysteinase [Candidatus Peregrinibacteria bacterium GW2011_GWA2_43_8]HAU40083.1 adenosylhomocysteinase [Candidatus Peregrinibacteria bacterium]